MTAAPHEPLGVGVLPFPGGLLLAGGDDHEHQAVRADLWAGRLPRHWPDDLAVLEHAAAGDLSEATRLARRQGRSDPIARYNHWILDPDGVGFDRVLARMPDPLRPLARIAAWTVGQTDLLPPPPAGGGELAALGLAANASQLIGRQQAEGAVPLMRRAVRVAGHGALAGVLHFDLASLLQHPEVTASVASVRVELEAALRRLEPTDLSVTRAELHQALGALDHAAATKAEDGDHDESLIAGRLDSAMHHYYRALALVTEESAPLLWAGIQLDLATAQLARPGTATSEQLRLGVVGMALRASRRVFTPAEHPERWSVATLNLAHALAYTPSSWHADNLREAVDLYQELLNAAVYESDPLSRALVLANQGTALAQLGRLERARERLWQAREAFLAQADPVAAGAVGEVLEELARTTEASDEGRITGRLPRLEAVTRPEPSGPVSTRPDGGPSRAGRLEKGRDDGHLGPHGHGHHSGRRRDDDPGGVPASSDQGECR